MREGRAALTEYLRKADALPLRDYVPLVAGTSVERFGRASCRGELTRSEPDDDINYSVLALLLLEERGTDLATEDVARAWLRYLPAGYTFTAEREAYRTLLARTPTGFAQGLAAGFDVRECAKNDYADWIGAQIRADVYGWVCPGQPALAADLARRDAELSHEGEGVYGAMLVAALGAALPDAGSLDAALERAVAEIPASSACAEAVAFGRALADRADAVDALHARYGELSPVHTVNNLALVVWALAAGQGDFDAAIGDAVAAGWDTDCNGATVGGLFGVWRGAVPRAWTAPWAGRVATNLAGIGELALDDLVTRTTAVAERL